MSNYSSQLRSQIEKYRKKGAIEAGRMRPATDSERIYDDVEVEIENEVKQLLAQEQKRVNDTTTLIENTYNKVESSFREFSVGLQEFINSRNTLQSALNKLLDSNRARITEIKRKRIAAEVDWRRLRIINNIHREAEYPENKVKYLFWILVIAFIELAANFVFFQDTDGFLTAFVTASAIVLFNLLGSFGFGFAFRYKNVVNPKWKQIAGWLCLPAYVVFTLFTNGLFARYRTEIDILKNTGQEFNFASDVMANALPGIIDGTSFQGIKSYIIFIVGIIASLYAFYKGYCYSDKFPGYATQDQKLKRARLAEHQAIDQLNKEMLDECKKVQQEIRKNQETPSNLIVQIGNHIASLERCRDEFNRAISAIKDDGTLLVTTYRSANRLVRPQAVPRYFDEDVTFDFMPNLRDVDEYVLKFERLRAEIENVRSNSEQNINVKKQEADKSEHDFFGDNVLNVKGVFREWQVRLDHDAEEKLVTARVLG